MKKKQVKKGGLNSNHWRKKCEEGGVMENGRREEYTEKKGSFYGSRVLVKWNKLSEWILRNQIGRAHV